MGDYDVIIVGAGPAGLSTALHLQQLAPELASRTLILEKARHPRPKPCAGGILIDGITILRDLGLDMAEIPCEKAVQAHFEFGGRGVTIAPKGEPVAFLVVHREEFDAWLAGKVQERGLTILEDTPAQKVSLSEDGVEVGTPRGTYRAKVVVGADGAHSIVRRIIMGNRRPSFSHTLILWVPPKPETSSHRQEDAYFEFSCISQDTPGYVWDFPIQIHGQLMRCWGVYNYSGMSRGRLYELLAQELTRHGYRLEDYPLYGESIPHFSTGGLLSAPRILLVGDAAGVDALYGEGISPALGYGKIAAAVIADAFAQEDFFFRDYRERVLHSELGKMLRRRAAMARVIYGLRSPSAQRLIWWHLGRGVRWIVQNFLVGWARCKRKP